MQYTHLLVLFTNPGAVSDVTAEIAGGGSVWERNGKFNVGFTNK